MATAGTTASSRGMGYDYITGLNSGNLRYFYVDWVNASRYASYCIGAGLGAVAGGAGVFRAIAV